MTRRPEPAPRGRTRWTICAFAALALAGCGGSDDGDAGSDVLADAIPEDERTDAEANGSGDGSDVGDDGSAFRPEWLPPWLFLPPGLEITIAPNDPSVGESFVTGFVAGGDMRGLYDDALFMVQSGGYIVSDEFEGPGLGISLEEEVPGMGFRADHTSDGSVVDFGVYEVDDATVQWNIVFTRPPSS